MTCSVARSPMTVPLTGAADAPDVPARPVAATKPTMKIIRIMIYLRPPSVLIQREQRRALVKATVRHIAGRWAENEKAARSAGANINEDSGNAQGGKPLCYAKAKSPVPAGREGVGPCEGFQTPAVTYISIRTGAGV